MKGLITWFARNTQAANCLMLLIAFVGVLSYSTIRQEFFPEFQVDMVVVRVPYPGATPTEVDTGIITRIEEALEGLDGVEELRSTASEGVGVVRVEATAGRDMQDLLIDVKNRVDAIDTFPENARQPVVEAPTLRRETMFLVLSAPYGDGAMRTLAESMRQRILNETTVTEIDILALRPQEVRVEISETDLRRYGLTFSDIANRIRTSSLDLPAGSIRTSAGEILLRTRNQAYTGEDYALIPLLTQADGTILRLGDVATVIDGVADIELETAFNGQPAAMLGIYRTGDQHVLRMAESVRDWIDANQSSFPPDVTIDVWQDRSELYRGRIDILTSNGLTGLTLVFLILGLFLRLGLAFWVSLGIPLSFAGAIALVGAVDYSLNMISLFAFILVIGIVVDDAIVVGESIYSGRGRDRVQRAIDGAMKVAKPVFLAVLTSIIAFAPMLFLSGTSGDLWRIIPTVVISTLAFSLVESLLILPNHLSHAMPKDAFRKPRPPLSWIHRVQDRFAHFLRRTIHYRFTPFLRTCLQWRYHTLAVFAGLLALAIGLIVFGFVRTAFFPRVENDAVAARVELRVGAPFAATHHTVERIRAGLAETRAHYEQEFGQDPVRDVLEIVGGTSEGEIPAANRAHLAEIKVGLLPAEERPTISSLGFAEYWREATGPLPGVESLTYNAELGSRRKDLDFDISGSDPQTILAVAERLRRYWEGFEGVYEIELGVPPGKDELEFTLLPAGSALGLTTADLARQLRQAFFGEEAERVQRGRNEVRVLVRYDDASRDRLGELYDLRIRTPDGSSLPLPQVARWEWAQGFSSITRKDRQRIVNVGARVNAEEVETDVMVERTRTWFDTEISSQHPQLRLLQGGDLEDRAELGRELRGGFMVSLAVIFALLAMGFRSWLQPLLIIGAVPFGLVGAVGGHWILGLEVSILSLIGMVALTGVVVNDGLVLIDGINNRRDVGLSLRDAMLAGCKDRFRPILLTTLTTFFGLLPLILETSLQAQFLIPMAVSLAFGVLFASVITLVLIPCAYLIIEDIVAGWRWAWSRSQ